MAGLLNSFNSLINRASGNDNANRDGVESSPSQESRVSGSPQGTPIGTANVNQESRTAVEGQWAGWGTDNVNTQRPTYGRRDEKQPQQIPQPSPFLEQRQISRPTSRVLTPQEGGHLLNPNFSFGRTASLMNDGQARNDVPLTSFPIPSPLQQPRPSWAKPNTPSHTSPNALGLNVPHQSTPKRQARPLPATPLQQGTLLSPVHVASPRQRGNVPLQHQGPQQGTMDMGYGGGGGRSFTIGGVEYVLRPSAMGLDGGAEKMSLDGVQYDMLPVSQPAPPLQHTAFPQPTTQQVPPFSQPPQPPFTQQAPPAFPPQPPAFQQPPPPAFQQPPPPAFQQPAHFAFPPQQATVFPPQGPFFPQQHFPAFAPQVQYVQVPVPTRHRQLPNTEKMEQLKGASNFAPWKLQAKMWIVNSGTYSHIAYPGEPGLRENQRAKDPPLETDPEFENWCVGEDLTKHIITSRLDPAILRSLPTIDAVNGGPVTARELWDLLNRQYGTGMLSVTLQKWNAVAARKVQKVSDLNKYATDLREAYNDMVVAGQQVSPASVLVTVANALPEIGSLASFARDLRNAADSPQGVNFHPIRVLESLDREVQNYLKKNPVAAPSSSSNPRRSKKVTCENCHREGHDKAKCWAPGGDAEGKRDEVMRERRGTSSGTRTAGIAAVASTPAPTQAPAIPQTPAPRFDGGADVVADHVPHVASIASVPQFQPFDAYDLALVAHARIFPEGYEHLLDSGCSLHLFNSHDVFWDFREGDTGPMKTANCGDLSTEGRGLVKLRLTREDGSGGFDLSLHDCRYAPSAPANLLSVGALQNKGIGINYSMDGDTYVDMRGQHTFKALRLGPLSFLKAEIVYPPKVEGVAAVSYRARAVDPETWHRRLGHLGMADTRRMLLGSYATGITYSGEMKDDLCPPCVVAKGSRQPVPRSGKRAERALELIHIDISGPYETHTKTGAYSGWFTYYIIFLDDWSNYGHTVLLKDRGGAAIRDVFVDWRRWMEKWTGCWVESVKMDGAKELTKGAFGEYLKQERIFADEVIPYHHWQNGKAERYIQTLDNTSRSMLAGSLLPTSFWGDGILAAQHLRNRVPTSTLPRDITPYERIFNKKPELSHLRVFGCLGQAWIPTEKRRKGDHRRTPVILVGYDSVHKGYWVVTQGGKHMRVSDVFFFENIQGRLQKNATPTGESPRVARSAPVEVEIEPEPTLAEMRAARLASLRSGTRQQNLPPPVSLFMVEPEGIQTMASYEVACSLVDVPTSDGDPKPQGTFDNESEDIEYIFIATRDDPTVFNRVRKQDLSRPPRNLKEAMARSDWPKWLGAMEKEVKGLFDMKTFLEVERLPPGRKAIPLLWVYAFKYNALGEIIDWKARLVVQGCRQRPEDYGVTSSPVARMQAFKTLLAFACKMNWSVYSFDIKTAFLHAILRELVFVGQIPGFPARPGVVYKLLRALYGLKQSAYEFYLFLKDSLAQIGIFHCDVERAVFVGIWSSSPDPSVPMPPNGEPLVLMIPVHVDDGLATTNSDPLYAWFIRRLSTLMQVKDLGEASLYLGIRIVRDRATRRMWLSQRAYIVDLLAEWKLSVCTGSRLPLLQPLENATNPSDNAYKNYTDEQVRSEYLRIVGSLQYLAICTRPDLSYTAMSLAQYNAAPTRTLLSAAKGVLRYLASTLDLALQYPATFTKSEVRTTAGVDAQDIRVETRGFTDSDWASDIRDRRSISGYAVYFMESLVSWSSNKQRVVALSSNEAELYALSHLTREILWFRMYLKSVRLPCPRPFPIFADNKSTVDMVHAENINGRSKHIDVRHHFVRDHVKEGELSVTWLSSNDNVADIFTKVLAKDKFVFHRTNLGLVSLPITETPPVGF